MLQVENVVNAKPFGIHHISEINTYLYKNL